MNQIAPRLADRLAGCAVLPPMPDDRPQRQELAVAAAGRADDEPATTTKPKWKPDRGPTRDRFHQLNAFVDFTASKLSRSEMLVWLTLYRDCRDGISKTAQADIARRTCVSLRSVGLAIRRLKRLGLLVIVRQGGLRQGPSLYRLAPNITEK